MGQQPINPFDELLKRDIVASQQQNAPAQSAGEALRNTAATVARVAPLGLRIGSSVAAAPFSAAGPVGMAAAAGIGGGGELLAQLLENKGDVSKLNLKRAAVEAGLSAVPFGIGKAKAAGNIGRAVRMGAAKGTALAGAGVVGRKATSDDPEEKEQALSPTQWSWLDLAQLPIGAAIGASFGRSGVKKAEPPTYEIETTATPGGRVLGPKGQPPQPSGSVRPIQGEGKPIDVQPEQPTGVPPVEGVSYTAPNVPTPSAARKEAQEAAQTARNENARDKWRQKGIEQDAKNEKLRDKYTRGMDKDRAAADQEDLARRQVAATKEGLEPKPPTVTESNSFTDETGRSSVSQRYGAPLDDTPPAPRPLPNRITPDERNGLAAMTPERAQQMLNRNLDEMVKSGELLKDGDNYRIPPKVKKTKATTPAGGAIAETPVAPLDDAWQVVLPSGRVIKATDEANVSNLMENFPGSTAIPPKTPTAPKPPRPKKVKGTAGEVTAKLEAKAAEVQPQAPQSGAAPIVDQPTSDVAKQAAEATVAENAAKRGTPADVPATPVAQQLEAERKAAEEGFSQAQKVAEDAKLSAPLAMEVANTVADVPAGSTIARFFRTPDAAMKAAAYAEELPDTGINSILNSLIGRADITTPTNQATGQRNAPSALWGMVRKIQKELNLPQFPRGAVVKPNFKHVPEGQRPASSAAVPVVDAVPPVITGKGGVAVAEPPRPAKQTPSQKKAQPAVSPATPAKAAAAPIAPQKAPTGPPTMTADGTPGMDINPNAPKPAVEPPAGPPLGEPRPVPPDLQMRIDTLKNQLKIKETELQQAGKTLDDAGYAKLSKELAGLQQEMWIAQYPELAAELARAEQAQKAAGKGKSSTPRPKMSANPMFDPEAYRWAGGLLGPEGVGALAGAGIGAATGDDPLKGAMLGGTAGYFGPKILRDFLTDPQAAGQVADEGKDLWSTVGRSLPTIQRGSLLAEPVSLGVNTFLAPWGASNLGAIERMLVAMAKGDAGEAQIYRNALKNLWSPSGQVNRFRGAVKEAVDPTNLNLLDERAEMMNEGVPKWIERIFGAPGRVMFAGDMTHRGALMDAGVPEKVARQITLTDNARTDWGEGIVNYAKAHPMLSFLQPFSRTAVNIVESGMERIPGLHILYNRTLIDPEMKATFAESAVRLGMDVAVGGLAYYIGATADPETARLRQFQKIIGNMAGQYGMIANAGFMMGQASQYGDSQGEALISSVTSELPLPQVSGVADLGKSLYSLAQGQPSNPDALYTPQRYVPRNILPGPLTDSALQRYSQYPIVGPMIEENF